jgi:hypothetical protein
MRGRRLLSLALKTAWALRAVVGKAGVDAERMAASARAWGGGLLACETCYKIYDPSKS